MSTSCLVKEAMGAVIWFQVSGVNSAVAESINSRGIGRRALSITPIIKKIIVATAVPKVTARIFRICFFYHMQPLGAAITEKANSEKIPNRQ